MLHSCIHLLAPGLQHLYLGGGRLLVVGVLYYAVHREDMYLRLGNDAGDLHGAA